MKLIRVLPVLMVFVLLSALLQVTKASEPQVQVPSLGQVYKEYFPIGAAVNSRTLLTHRDLIKKHFGSVTAENEMKFDHIQPFEGVYTFDRADEIVDFARENDLMVRGHTLVWHNQAPAWVFKGDNGEPVSRAVLLHRMKEHIHAVVGRYKGAVYAWDVVNEAVSDREGFLRADSPWYKILGEDYIAKAFEYAHEADPEAKLFYNDYNAVNPDKRDKIYKLLKSLLDRGVPVHGIGIQAHWDIYGPSLADIEAAIKKYASLGLEVQITELDVSLFAWGDKSSFTEPPQEFLEKQARRYRELFELFRKHSDVITGVTFWGIADDSTWKDDFPVKGRNDWPLLFDDNHQPKKCFWEIVNFD